MSGRYLITEQNVTITGNQETRGVQFMVSGYNDGNVETRHALSLQHPQDTPHNTHNINHPISLTR